METTSLFIKNMVCSRCIRVVKEELEKTGLDVRSITLGEAVVTGKMDSEKLQQIRKILADNGFELIDDKKVKIIEKIKTLIVELIHHKNPAEHLPINYSHYLSEALNLDYHYLSTLFSSIENTTIEKYIILQKIERVKELLVYNELTLSEVAYQMGYSSVQHLSNQFKKITGYTPSHFKQIKENKRQPLDKVGGK
jgi:AraC family transcriptional regulator